MSTATIQALTTLLPHLTASTVPRPLIDTADSLVALSRQRAPTLKRDEEIARAHACAEIACGRLREKLRLPAVKTGSAPASKRTYTKLLRFLDEVLRGATTDVAADAAGDAAGPSGKGASSVKRKRGAQPHDEEKEVEDGEALLLTPRKRQRSVASTPTTAKTATTASARRAASSRTPSSTAAAKNTKTRLNASSGLNIHVSTNDPSEAPSFVLPLVRQLCAHFRTPSMAPHVYIGCIVALTKSGLWPRGAGTTTEEGKEEEEVEGGDDDTFEHNVKTLIMAVWMMVLTRMMNGRMEKPLFRDLTSGMMQVGELTPRTNTKRGAEKEVEEWVKKVHKSGWARGQEWWEEVPTGCWDFSLQDGQGQQLPDVNGGNDEIDMDGEEAEQEEAEAEQAEEEKGRREDLNLDPDPEGVLLPGLGTMMQDAVDWLSDERISEFKSWKSDTLRQIEQIVMARGKRVGRTSAVAAVAAVH